jgi:acetyl-CoA carboxylase biotin carboxyl carrier protein
MTEGASVQPADDPGKVLSEPDSASIAADPGDASLLALIDRLAALLQNTDLTELEVEVRGTGVTLRKPAAFGVAPAVGATEGSPGQTGSAAGSAATGSDTAGSAGVGAEPAVASRPSVKAPLTGIFYNAPSPGSAPYVKVGGEIAVGQVIGLIEAMKLFNEIKSDLAGRVVRFATETGQLVKARQPLIEVEPL